MEGANVNGSSSDGGGNAAPSELKPFVQPPPPKTLKRAGVVPDPRLEAGKQLPGAGKSPIGVPLQDPDPAYAGFDVSHLLDSA